jgi:hypothetical protein
MPAAPMPSRDSPRLPRRPYQRPGHRLLKQPDNDLCSLPFPAQAISPGLITTASPKSHALHRLSPAPRRPRTRHASRHLPARNRASATPKRRAVRLRACRRRHRDCRACHQPHGSNNPKMSSVPPCGSLSECHTSKNALSAQPPSFHDLRSLRHQNCTTVT